MSTHIVMTALREIAEELEKELSNPDLSIQAKEILEETRKQIAKLVETEDG